MYLRRRRLLCLLALPAVLSAQNNLKTTVTQRYFNGVRRNLEAAADAMPAAKYAFKLTDGQMSFAEWLNHSTERNYSDCATLKGEPAPEAAKKVPALKEKAEVSQALKDSLAYCAAAIEGVDDQKVLASPQMTYALLHVVVHNNEIYGNIAGYLRVSGIVPPSTTFRMAQANQQPVERLPAQLVAPGRGVRPPTPTRDPNTPGYVKAKELPDGSVPSPTANGNFIIGPTHNPAPEMAVKDGVPHGDIFEFTMESKDSKIYPGIAREPNTFARPDPSDPAKLQVNSHPAPYTRKVAVYVPKQYVPGTEAPFIVGADGPDRSLFTALDNLIAEKRVPVMIAISIGNGSGDAQGSERGLEYDTMSGLYAEFVEKEVLPLVERQYKVKLTKNPEGRATMGCSSGGAAAMAMAWYHPDLYHRVLSYSGTFVYQQWPYNPETPHGAWDFHEKLIPNSPRKPLRIWMAVSDRDNLNTRDNYHDWVLANENMAKVLAEKGYPYQFVFAKDAGHCDRGVKAETLPLALEYVWQGYKR